jgi:hypothetical protein
LLYQKKIFAMERSGSDVERSKFNNHAMNCSESLDSIAAYRSSNSSSSSSAPAGSGSRPRKGKKGRKNEVEKLTDSLNTEDPTELMVNLMAVCGTEGRPKDYVEGGVLARTDSHLPTTISQHLDNDAAAAAAFNRIDCRFFSSCHQTSTYVRYWST